MESKTVTIKIPASLEKSVREVAEAERRSMSAQIRVVLEQWIEKLRK